MWGLESLGLLACFVVKSLVGKNWTSNALDNSLPCVGLSRFTHVSRLVGDLSSEESTSCSALPHINGGVLARSDLASWHPLGSK